MTVGIVGMGLIGGSMAKSIKLNTGHTVLGADMKETEMLKAELVGAIDGRLDDKRLRECDVVIVALYPSDSVAYITDHAAYFGQGALVVDCGGVKRVVCEALRETTLGRQFTFIGGHPMAGREYSGFQYAQDDLFERASMILTPYPDAPIELVARAKAFFMSAGFLRVVFTTPERHDEMIAYTSQMAHIISSAYVKSELAMKHKGFSAGSFQDMTRVARLNETMWAELFLSNREPLIHELDGIISRLHQYRRALEQANRAELEGILREGREVKEMLSEG